MSDDNKHKVTIFTEGSSRTNGTNSKPVTPKPKVSPSGQQTQKTNNSSEKK